MNKHRVAILTLFNRLYDYSVIQCYFEAEKKLSLPFKIPLKLCFYQTKSGNKPHTLKGY